MLGFFFIAIFKGLHHTLLVRAYVCILYPFKNATLFYCIKLIKKYGHFSALLVQLCTYPEGSVCVSVLQDVISCCLLIKGVSVGGSLSSLLMLMHTAPAAQSAC